MWSKLGGVLGTAAFVFAYSMRNEQEKNNNEEPNSDTSDTLLRVKTALLKIIDLSDKEALSTNNKERTEYRKSELLSSFSYYAPWDTDEYKYLDTVYSQQWSAKEFLETFNNFNFLAVKNELAKLCDEYLAIGHCKPKVELAQFIALLLDGKHIIPKLIKIKKGVGIISNPLAKELTFSEVLEEYPNTSDEVMNNIELRHNGDLLCVINPLDEAELLPIEHFSDDQTIDQLKSLCVFLQGCGAKKISFTYNSQNNSAESFEAAMNVDQEDRVKSGKDEFQDHHSKNGFSAKRTVKEVKGNKITLIYEFIKPKSVLNLDERISKMKSLRTLLWFKEVGILFEMLAKKDPAVKTFCVNSSNTHDTLNNYFLSLNAMVGIKKVFSNGAKFSFSVNNECKNVLEFNIAIEMHDDLEFLD